MEEIFGQSFTQEEICQMRNFGDLAKSYYIGSDLLLEYIDLCKNVGSRLYVAVNVSLEDIGGVLLQEKEPRLIAVMKKRLEEEKLQENKGLHT